MGSKARKRQKPRVRRAIQRLELQAERADFSARASATPPSQAELERMAKKARAIHRPLPGPVVDVPEPDDTIFPEDDGPATSTLVAATSPKASARQFGVRGASGGSRPPDTIGVSDKKSLMVATNQQVWGYARSATNKYRHMTLDAFFTQGIAIKPKSVIAFDPYMVRDPLSNQYVAVALNDPRNQKGEPGLFLGSTQAGDVLGNWQYVWISCKSLGLVPGLWFDYPRVGTSKNFLTVSVNLYNKSGAYQDAMLLVINKPPYYKTGAVALTAFIGGPATMVPVRSFDSGSGHYVMATGTANDGSGHCMVQLLEVTGSFSNNTVNITGPINIAANLPYQGSGGVIGPQKGSTKKLDTGDNRMQSAVFRGGSVWCTHSIYLPLSGTVANSGIQVYQINPSSPSLTQAARYFDTSKAWFYAYPSIAVNALGDVLIGMAAFNAAVTPQGTYTCWGAKDAKGTLRTTGSTITSKAAWTLGRWGDYSATIVDPVDDKRFWTLQETANGSKQWWTSWMQVPKIS